MRNQNNIVQFYNPKYFNKLKPSKKTRLYFEHLGYQVISTEHKDPFQKFRTHDLLECIDELALGHNQVIGIQSTTAPNHAARRNKITELINANKPIKNWLAKCELWIVSWNTETQSQQPRIEKIEL